MAGFANQTLGMRRIHGALFLATTIQVNELGIFRFDPAKTGDAAIPSAIFAHWHTGKSWPASQPVGNRGFIWNDLNGDGQQSADEYQKDTRGHGGVRTMLWLDDDGNEWSYEGESQQLQRLTVAPRLDAHGNPQWRFDSPDNLAFPLPEAFKEGELRTVRVGAGDGPVFLCGFTKTEPKTFDGNCPVGRVLIRYERTGKDLVEAARISLPYDVHFGQDPLKEKRDYPAAISLAGDYVFVAYQRTMNTLVYRADNLALVGRIDVGQQVHTPIIDGPAEMIARKRSKTDEYVLFFPMYVGNATTVVRWKPSDKSWLPSPAKVRVAAGTVTWDAVPGATGYAIER